LPEEEERQMNPDNFDSIGDTTPAVSGADISNPAIGSGPPPPITWGTLGTGNIGVSGVGIPSPTASGIDVSGIGVFAQTEGYGTGLYAVNGEPTYAIFPGTPVFPFAEGRTGNDTSPATSGTSSTSLHAVSGDTNFSSQPSLSPFSGPGVPPIPPSAILAEGGTAPGIIASSNTSTAISGSSTTGTGVYGESTSASGIGITAYNNSEGVALQVIGKIEVQSNSVGSVTMAAGTKTLTVSNAAATANSLILLTPLNNPLEFLWIGARYAGSFTIDAGKPLPFAVTIMFLIIN
jgi:hypothetical protein